MDGDGLACWWWSGGIRLSLYLVRATCHGRHLAHVYWTRGFLLWAETEQLQWTGLLLLLLLLQLTSYRSRWAPGLAVTHSSAIC